MNHFNPFQLILSICRPKYQAYIRPTMCVAAGVAYADGEISEQEIRELLSIISHSPFLDGASIDACLSDFQGCLKIYDSRDPIAIQQMESCLTGIDKKAAEAILDSARDIAKAYHFERCEQTYLSHIRSPNLLNLD